MLDLPTPIELLVPSDIGYVHTRTKEQPRLSDGIKHPIKVTKVSPEEMERLWYGDGQAD